MIIKYSNPIQNGFKGVLSYHEKKEKEGRGEEIYSTIPFKELKEKASYMDSTKGEKATNFGFDITFNFNLKDNVDDEKAKSIIGEFLNDTNFNGHDFVINKHTDKKHTHYHLTICNYNQAGERNEYLRGFYKKEAKELGVKYENLFDLEKTNFAQSVKKDLPEINQNKYALQNAVVNILSKEEIQLDSNLYMRLTDEYLTNNKVVYLLRDEPKLLNKATSMAKGVSKKNVIIEELKVIKNQSKNYEEFKSNLEKKDFYFRETGGREKNLSYGKKIGKDMFYLAEKSMPKELRYYNLYNNYNLKENADDTQEVKAYVKRNVNLALSSTNTYMEFKEELIKKNIEVIEAENKRGVYGISFATEFKDISYKFKASEVSRDLSFANLQRKFNELAYSKTNNPFMSNVATKETGGVRKLMKGQTNSDQEIDQHIDQEREQKENSKGFDYDR